MTFNIWTDGGARGNPGPAAIGFVIKQGNEVIYQHKQFIGKATNNVAEYTAVLRALEWLSNNYPITKLSNYQINFHIDSLLIVQQLNGSYKIKNLGLKSLAISVKQLEAKLKIKVAYKKIPREQNKIADSLVNQALDTLIN
jgi:ribonuclease HI